MPGKTQTLRPKTFNVMFSSKASPAHGHWIEYFVDSVTILMNIFFIIGCYCFESSSNSVYAFGDWLFITACIVNAVIAINDFIEALHKKNIMNSTGRDEILETGFFVLANVLFAVGCVFFLPGVKYLGKFYYTASAIGAWLCILGSFGLLYGTFYTAIYFEHEPDDSQLDPETRERCRQLTKMNINATLIGSALFLVGSFMYRPIFGGLCPPRSTASVCEAVSSYGTKCYLYGCYLFFVASIFALMTTYLKHTNSQAKNPTETTKLMP